MNELIPQIPNDNTLELNDKLYWRYTFAGMAMQGMIINGGSAWGNDVDAAVECADALLAKLKEDSNG